MAKTREQLERAIFILECKDHWTDKDFTEYYKMCAELRELGKA